MQPPPSPPPPRLAPFTVKRLLSVSPALLMLAVLLAVSQMAASRYSAGTRYRECSALAASDPARALAEARAWRGKDAQSPVAEHCEAIALYANRQYAPAGALLEALAQNAASRNSLLAAGLALQAALADEAAGQNPRALAVLSGALDHGGSRMAKDDRVQLLSERARLYRATGQPLLAVQDLDNALALAPGNAGVKALLLDTAQKITAPPATLPDK